MSGKGFLRYEFEMRGHDYRAYWMNGSDTFLVKNEDREFRVEGLKDDCGLGRLKAALKRAMRKVASRIANMNGLDAPVIKTPQGSKGYIFAFNPKVRFAAACQMVGL